MPGRVSRSGFTPYVTLTAAFALILLWPGAPRAQSSRSERDARRAEMEMRQRVLWNLERLKNGRPAKAADKRPAYRDVAEHFEQLQLRNYSLSGAAVQGAPLDYALIKREAAGVKKHASRLKGYLSLPEPEEGHESNKGGETLTPEGLSSAIASLDALVNSFVWNPVFRRPDVVDVEQSSKASRDLAGIVNLSERIQRCAEELSKRAGKK